MPLAPFRFSSLDLQFVDKSNVRATHKLYHDWGEKTSRKWGSAWRCASKALKVTFPVNSKTEKAQPIRIVSLNQIRFTTRATSSCFGKAYKLIWVMWKITIPMGRFCFKNYSTVITWQKVRNGIVIRDYKGWVHCAVFKWLSRKC